MNALISKRPPTTSGDFRRGWHTLPNGNPRVARHVLHAATLLLLFAGVLQAQQPASSLSDLPTLARTGDRIEVALSDGSVLKGEYELSNDSLLRMRLKSRSQDISGTTITSIRRRRPDSNLNGTLIGLAVGFGAGLVAVNATCGSHDSECSAIASVILLPTFAAGGAGVGALMDGLTYRYDPIYASKITGGTRLRLSPIVSRDKKGVRLAMSF